MTRCSICGYPFPNWNLHGNNAQPINSGRCCDWCNNLVTARRINDIRFAEKDEIDEIMDNAFKDMIDEN
jgi:hypothetical protein